MINMTQEMLQQMIAAAASEAAQQATQSLREENARLVQSINGRDSEPAEDAVPSLPPARTDEEFAADGHLHTQQEQARLAEEQERLDQEERAREQAAVDAALEAERQELAATKAHEAEQKRIADEREQARVRAEEQARLAAIESIAQQEREEAEREAALAEAEQERLAQLQVEEEARFAAEEQRRADALREQEQEAELARQEALRMQQEATLAQVALQDEIEREQAEGLGHQEFMPIASDDTAFDDPFAEEDGQPVSRAGDSVAPPVQAAHTDIEPFQGAPAGVWDEEPHLPAVMPAVTVASPSVSYTDQAEEPEDLLYAIAIQDPAANAATDATAVVDAMRDEAKDNSQRTKNKRTKDKQRRRPLAFHLIERGQPLVAACFAASGGTGKSSTTLNLGGYVAAVAQLMIDGGRLSSEDAPRILVLDGDIAHGSLALRLTGKLQPSMHSLLLYHDQREQDGMHGASAWPTVYDQEDAAPGEQSMSKFVMHSKEFPNLDLLAAPDDPDKFYDFGPEEYHDILTVLGRFYDVILIDCGTEITLESQRAWLMHADQVFIITAPVVDRLFNGQKAVSYMTRARPHPTDPDGELRPPLATADKLAVLMTKADADTGLGIQTSLERNFGRWIPEENWLYSPDVTQVLDRANNTGEFLALTHKGYGEAIGAMAEHMFKRRAAENSRHALPAHTSR